jgi:hypothetical protein
MAGYSGTPLAKKLGFKSGAVVCVVGEPSAYRTWLEPLPTGIRFRAKAGAGSCDFVHLFVESLKTLDRGLPAARRMIAPDGAIWVSWPKRASKVPTDVTEDAVRDRALATDLVDVKVCAVTEIWSGLKLVVRKQLR